MSPSATTVILNDPLLLPRLDPDLQGWRMGYIAFTDRQPGGWSLNDELLKVQDTTSICPPVISQHVALGALSAGKPWVQGKLASVERNREAVEVMALATFSSFWTTSPTFSSSVPTHTLRGM